MPPIYLDYNATTPPAGEVIEAMMPYFYHGWGNPSSHHFYGETARNAIEKARSELAALLNCSPNEIIFTGGGTEGNNIALKGAALANRHRGNHIITSTIEHPAVSEVCDALAEDGFEISRIPVNRRGQVNPDDIANAITEKTIVISIMHANNEIGSIQPISVIAEIARSRDVLLHSDAAQSVGKIPVDVQALGVDLLSVAGHKFYAPKGVGALYIRRGVHLKKWLHGAAHERNLRPGTENTPAIVGLGTAARLAADALPAISTQLRTKRDYFYRLLKTAIPELLVNGHLPDCLPNTLNVAFPNFSGSDILALAPDVAAATGSACHSGEVQLSPTIRAMELPEHYQAGVVRFSIGSSTTEADLQTAANAIIRAYETLTAKHRHT
jgi:cysteine desulfurase